MLSFRMDSIEIRDKFSYKKYSAFSVLLFICEKSLPKKLYSEEDRIEFPTELRHLKHFLDFQYFEINFLSSV